MGIDIKTIICPQCSSTDIKMVSETRGVCNHCGSQISVTPSTADQAQNGDDAQLVSWAEKIENEYTEQDFIRAAWIKLAEKDPPFDIFKSDFSEVEKIDHQVFIDRYDADVTYNASVGHNREEPYIDYETYHEEENYVDTNGNVQTRRVEKQRPVTKYKTVTDWSPVSGKLSTTTISYAENLPDVGLSKDRFKYCFSHAKDSSVIPLENDVIDKIEMSSSAERHIYGGHNSNIIKSIESSLSGDEKKNIHYQVERIYDQRRCLCFIQEYKATITYNGQTASCWDYPIEKPDILGPYPYFENKENLNTTVTKKKADIPKQVRRNIKPVSIVTYILLVLSLVVSFFFLYTVPIILLFVAATASYVYNNIVEKKETARITAEVEAECEEYTKNYKKKQRELLNGKLTSLGLAPLEDPAEDDKEE